jgi:hypothetical protein
MAGVKTFIVLLALCGGAGFFLYKALFPSIPERDWTQFDVPESDAVVEMPGTPSARALALPPDAPMIGGLWHLERPREHFTFGVLSNAPTASSLPWKNSARSASRSATS